MQKGWFLRLKSTVQVLVQVLISSHPVLDGNGVKAMPGSISVPNPGSFNKEKKKTLLGSQMGKKH